MIINNYNKGLCFVLPYYLFLILIQIFIMQVIYCTEDMITRSLWEAMNTKQSHLEALKVEYFNILVVFSFLLVVFIIVFVHTLPMNQRSCVCLTSSKYYSEKKPIGERKDLLISFEELMNKYRVFIVFRGSIYLQLLSTK